MFVKNRTPFRPVLAKGNLSDSIAVGAISIEHVYRILRDGRLELCAERPATQPTDPPDILRQPVWAGASVTAAGTVHGPSAAPFLRPVSLTVGREIRRLVVFGERRWQSTIFGELEASAPERFESMELSFAKAFGGGVDILPGIDERSGLAQPGGRSPYPLNGDGIGYYRDLASAKHAPLPNIELADQMITRWDDKPMPGCFVPCPTLVGLRLQTPALLALLKGRSAETAERRVEFSVRAGLNLLHHAPGYLIFDGLGVTTPIRLEGLGGRPLSFGVPPPEAAVHLRHRRERTGVSGVLRSLHVDADQETVSCVVGYAFRYEPSSGPSWIEITL